MKTLIFAALLFVNGISVYAQQDKPVESTISQVTVFLNRAQVTRVVKTKVEAGKTNLVLTGLTSQLDQQSVQVSGKGSIIILGISHSQNYLNELNKPKKLKVLEDSLHYYRNQLTLEQNQKDIYTKEEQLIISNQKIGGNNQNLTVAELKAMADFYRSRLGEIGKAKIKTDEKINQLTIRIAKINQQLREMNELYSRNASEIVISVTANIPSAVELEVRYIVPNAGWYPVYDLRAVNTKSPIQFNYKANVYQRTGEEWNNVKLKLSTGNPALGGTKPELGTWLLDFYQPMVRAMQGKERAKVNAAPEMMMDVEVLSEVSGTAADFVQTIQTSLNTEFDIGLPYSVLSASKPTLVDIQSREMNAVYHYSTTPKLDHDAFLLAKATGWEEFNILPGEANIFFEGTFVGKTFIDPNSVNDTLAISLGRDQRIVVKREKVKDFTTRRAIGSNIREAYAWEISVRNTKNEPVKIIVEDQVPISMNNQIEVSVTDTGGARYNKETGKLQWEITLQPAETKKVVFKYEVKYPKDKQISGL
jgi:uncharacterized protein (TIGR02231 family)